MYTLSMGMQESCVCMNAVLLRMQCRRRENYAFIRCIRNSSVVDPDPVDLGLFGHPDPDP